MSRCLCTLSAFNLVSVGRQNTTLDILLQCGIHYDLVLGSVTLAERVTESGAVMSQERKLVNSGDFIEVVTSQFEVRLEETFPTYIFTQIQMQYGILLATFKRNDGSVTALFKAFISWRLLMGRPLRIHMSAPFLNSAQQSSVLQATTSDEQYYLFMNAVIHVCFLRPQQWTMLKEKRSQSNPNYCSSMIGKIICIVLRPLIRKCISKSIIKITT